MRAMPRLGGSLERSLHMPGGSERVPRVEPERRETGWKRAQRHSRLVRSLRFVLPLTGGVIAAALLVSFESIPSPIGDIELGTIGIEGDRVTMDAPKLSGYGDTGMSYAVSAAKAQQSLSTPNVVHLEEIEGRLDEEDGWTSLSAERGLLDTEAETLRLDQEIELTTQDGKRAKLKSANIDFSKKTVTTEDAVEMEMDVGRVQANSMSVSEGGKRILLRGNVSVDLRPDGMRIDETAQSQ